MDSNIEIKDLKGFVRRRKKSFFIIFLMVFFLTATRAAMLPPEYRAEVTIMIQGQQIPQDYVKSTVTSYAEERLQLITRQVMSRAKLMEIINKFKLYPERRDSNSMARIIEKMSKDITLETISADVMDNRTGRQTKATIAFTLSYQGKNPEAVQKVTNVLASLYLEENFKTRGRQARDTSRFLEEELKQMIVKIRHGLKHLLAVIVRYLLQIFRDR